MGFKFLTGLFHIGYLRLSSSLNLLRTNFESFVISSLNYIINLYTSFQFVRELDLFSIVWEIMNVLINNFIGVGVETI
jgi:hypothetical protein